jgi:CRISPR-associated protein Csx17
MREPAVVLTGCSPEPIASYLKALGVLRLVAEQLDPNVAGAWVPTGFALYGEIDAERLVTFLTSTYVPSPIVAPWNGGSGFFDTKAHDGTSVIRASRNERLAPYRSTIEACSAVLAKMQLSVKPEKEQKPELIACLRAELSDDALSWLDAAVVLSNDGLRFPALLGTGGCDGNLDFSNNQMQRLAELLEGAVEGAAPRLCSSLFGEPMPNLRKNTAIGQFAPAAAGGTNASSGFDREALVNPWDYVLLLEGVLVFVTALTRRDEADCGSVAFPFMVSASPVGYGSASLGTGESEEEIWLPLWSAPSLYREVRHLFGEGRAKVGAEAARTGVDFARAVVSLGVDRGLSSFTRFGFKKRNGRTHFATPLGRFSTKHRPEVAIIRDLDVNGWLERLRRVAADRLSPSSLRRAARQLDDAIIATCGLRGHAAFVDVLVAVGEIEAAIASSPAAEEKLRPVPRLTAEWATNADDGSPEFRLAAALAAEGLREHLVPIDLARPWEWRKNDDLRVVWGTGSLVANLGAVLRRRDLDRSIRSKSEVSRDADREPRRTALLADIAAFIDGRVDDGMIAALARGLAIVDWPLPAPPRRANAAVPAAFALLHLAHRREPRPGVELPPTPGLLARALAGDVAAATQLAIRRLRSAGLPPRCSPIATPPDRARRIAAALAFPLAAADRVAIANQILGLPSEEENDSHVDATA